MGGLAIHKAEVAEGGNIVADRRLYRTADDRIVEAGDADARYLLASGAGDLIAPDVVKSMRLEVKDGKVAQAKPDPDALAEQGAVSDAEKDALAVGLKVAADEQRKKDLGKGQTQVALTEPPPLDETAAGRARARAEDEKARSAASAPAAPAQPVRVARTAPAARSTPAPKPASATKTTSTRAAGTTSARKSGTAKNPSK